jgi:hypothetical protein
MPHLNIKLRDGFQDDEVVLTLDEKEIYRRTALSSDLTISFADALELEVEKNIAQLAVAVAGRPKQSVQIDLNETPFIEIWIIDNQLEIRASKSECPML